MDDTTAGRSTSITDLERILAAATTASRALGARRPAERAEMLRTVADRLDGADDELVAVAVEESHLPEARLRGELARTTFQLRLFGDVVDDGAFLGVTIDPRAADWPPGPRPDLRRMLRPLGPVVVFAAGNFPFAFSVAGGDTASALAAGCPVVLKAHPGHPGLSRRCGAVVVDALRDAGAPSGSFAMIYGEEAGRAAVLDGRVTAGAFTGSLAGGRALYDLAASRPAPIPFYGELGSLNPVFVTAAALIARRDEILTGFVDSFTLGAGQFCTKPGVLVVPADSGVEAELVALVGGRPGAPLLSDHIQRGYLDQLDRLRDHGAVRSLVDGVIGPDGPAPSLLAVTAEDAVANADDLLVECFGPVSLIISYGPGELLSVAEALDGQLTAGVHGQDDDLEAPELLETLAGRAGRVLWNAWPTGVTVTSAMHHGGPYPATTAPLSTSVGTAAIERFLRPVAYQSVPDHLLPEALRDANPLGVACRRVDGRSVLAPGR